MHLVYFYGVMQYALSILIAVRYSVKYASMADPAQDTIQECEKSFPASDSVQILPATYSEDKPTNQMV